MVAILKRSKNEGAAPEVPTGQQKENISVMPQIPEKQPAPVQPEQPQTQVTPQEAAPQPQQLQPEQQPQVPEQAPVQPEQQPSPEQQQPGVRAATQQKDDDAAQPAMAQPAQPQATKTKEREEIEGILSEGLTEIYQGMTPQEQEKFRLKGEEAATNIEAMMQNFKASARKVVDIIRTWLSTIPRVNKYFLEQESKLKTDEIMKLQRKLKKQYKLNKRLQK